MKTITKSEQLLELSEGAVILTSDGIPAQLVMNQATYRRDGGGRYHWQRTDGTYLTHTFSALLPAALLYPVIFDAEDVHVATGLASTADPYRELHPSQAESIARAVLGAVGSMEA